MRSQAPLDADRTLRTGHRSCAGAGGMFDIGGGTFADAALMAGRVMSESLLVGLEAGFAYRDDSETGEPAAGEESGPEVEHYFVAAVAAWFPFSRRGAYVKAGAGYGTATEEWHDNDDWDTAVRKRSYSGVSALAAAGWEFRVNDKLGLGIEVGALARPGLEQVDPEALLTITRYWGDRP